MTTQLDFQIGLAKETEYGVAVPVTRFPESEAKGKFDITRADGKVLRPGRRVTRLNRTSVVHKEGSVEIACEVPTKGFGLLLNSVLGAVANTVVPTLTPTRYQQVHTLRTEDPVDSYTIQEAIPHLGGGAPQPHTFLGCVGNQLTLSAKEGDFLQATLSYLARDMVTTEPAAVASYPEGDGLFTFVHGSIGYAGTLTAPTTTAIGSLSGDPAANVSDFTITVNNQLDTGGFNIGGQGKRSRRNAIGAAAVTGQLTAEYTDNVLRDAYLAQTPLPLVLTFAHDDDVSVLQIVLPCLLVNGEVPTSNGGAPVTQSVPFTVFDNGVAAQPITIVYRTTDTAL